MKARDVMKSPVITVRQGATLAEVARLLDENKISGMPVVNPQGELVGIVSEHDLITRSQRLQVKMLREPFGWLSPHTTLEEIAQFTRGLCEVGDTRVEEVMTKKVVTVSEDDSLEEVARLVGRRKINRVPVLRQGKLVGIISRGDLVWAMANLCERKPGILN
ncbi:MAG: CBS domain-containing protein [bacterium]|nr:CBS domain-containing protein [bacterium]